MRQSFGSRYLCSLLLPQSRCEEIPAPSSGRQTRDEDIVATALGAGIPSRSCWCKVAAKRSPLPRQVNEYVATTSRHRIGSRYLFSLLLVQSRCEEIPAPPSGQRIRCHDIPAPHLGAGIPSRSCWCKVAAKRSPLPRQVNEYVATTSRHRIWEPVSLLAPAAAKSLRRDPRSLVRSTNTLPRHPAIPLSFPRSLPRT